MVDPATFLTIITPIVSGGLSGATTVGLFKGPVKTLEDWWFVNFGASLSQQAALLRAEQEANVEKLKSGILDNVSKIEPENIQEPKLNILGPALEASKYYIEDEELRDMFAKLIASSMDKSKNDIVRSSFVEIIKQMNPLDAANLIAVTDTSNPDRDLTCEFKMNFLNGGFKTLLTNLYLGNKNEQNQSHICTSLSNLKRLGLIDITYQEYRNSEMSYQIFEKLSEYQEIENYISEQNKNFELLRQKDPENPSNDIILSGPEITKGLIKITNFGEAFSSVCL